MSSAMPNDTVFITILRHPYSLFESTFSYFELPKQLHIPGKTLHEQMQNFAIKSSVFMKKAGPSERLIQNGMTFDLGLDREHFYKENKIAKLISHLENKFGLVLILEHFDESLILLKRLLCWSIEDVTYFRMLQRQTKINQLSSDIKKFIEKFNQADLMLFNHFNKTLWKRIGRQDQDFFEEVKQLKALNKHLHSKCGSTSAIASGHYTHVKVVSLRTIASNLTATEKRRCCQMTMSEVKYIKHLNAKKLTPTRRLDLDC